MTAWIVNTVRMGNTLWIKSGVNEFFSINNGDNIYLIK